MQNRRRNILFQFTKTKHKLIKLITLLGAEIQVKSTVTLQCSISLRPILSQFNPYGMLILVARPKNG
jgi:hypothetical protein